jgi:hypothetical protein
MGWVGGGQCGVRGGVRGEWGVACVGDGEPAIGGIVVMGGMVLMREMRLMMDESAWSLGYGQGIFWALLFFLFYPSFFSLVYVSMSRTTCGGQRGI